jgi:hypothetical protein
MVGFREERGTGRRSGQSAFLGDFAQGVLFGCLAFFLLPLGQVPASVTEDKKPFSAVVLQQPAGGADAAEIRLEGLYCFVDIIGYQTDIFSFLQSFP